MIPDEYITKVAEHLKTLEQNWDQKINTAQTEAAVRKTKAPKLWAEVIASIRDAVAKVEQHVPFLKLHELKYELLVLILKSSTNKRFRELNVTFDGYTGTISYCSDHVSGDFVLTIKGENAFYIDAAIDSNPNLFRLPLQADDVAKRLIDIICG